MSTPTHPRTGAFTVPGPAPFPVLGPLGNLARLSRDPIKYMGRLFRDYGPVAALAAGGRSRVFSTQPTVPALSSSTGPNSLARSRPSTTSITSRR